MGAGSVAFIGAVTALATCSGKTPFSTENDASMAKMMAAMDVKPSGDADVAFVALMVPHHRPDPAGRAGRQRDTAPLSRDRFGHAGPARCPGAGPGTVTYGSVRPFRHRGPLRAIFSGRERTPKLAFRQSDDRMKETGVLAGEQLPAGTRSQSVAVALTVNGELRRLEIDPRLSILDLLRERLGLTGTKKGCNQGACGACTVLLNGKRINACLTLAVMHQGAEITTIERLADGETLHPLQAAFIEHEGFQCGYCTPGQILSGIGCIAEGHATSPDEIRFWMSGNICRCGAYPGIVAAVGQVAQEG